MASNLDGNFPSAPEYFQWEYTSPRLVYPFDQPVLGVNNQTHALTTLYDQVLVRGDPYPLAVPALVGELFDSFDDTLTSSDGVIWTGDDGTSTITLQTNVARPHFTLTATTANGSATWNFDWDGYDGVTDKTRVTYSGQYGQYFSLSRFGSDGWHTQPDPGAQGTVVPLDNPTFNAAGDTATFQLPTNLPAGNYEGILSSAGITDTGGTNHLDGDATTTESDDLHEDLAYPFFIFPGDANHDRTINIDDYGRIDGHYPAVNGYINGDFNYDGVIDSNDYFIIDHNFATVLPAMPTAPNTLVAFASRDAQGVAMMTLNWVAPTDVTNIDGYGIWLSTDGGVTFNFLTSVSGGNTTSYQHTGLADGTKYTYRLRAHSPTGGYSTTSNKAWAVTNLPGPGQDAPIVSNITSTGFTLAWNDNSTNEAGFEIDVIDPAGNVLPYYAPAQDGAGTASFDVTGLTPNTAYQVKVRAYTAPQVSAWSPTVDVTTLQLVNPASLSATAVSFSQIDLAWSDNSLGETGFVIESSTDGVNFDYLTQVGPDTASYPATGLSPQTTYYFRVYATANGTDSAPTNIASAATFAMQPPTGLAASNVTATEADLTWTASPGDIASYQIDWKANTADFQPLTTVDAPTLSYHVKNLLPGTTYHFRVSAIAETGSSQPCADISTTTVPPAPSALRQSGATDTSVTLTWDPAAGSTGYQVQRIDGSWTTIGTTAWDHTTFTDESAIAGRVYRVIAVGASGISEPSSSLGAAPRPSAPTDFHATASLYPGRYELNWTENSPDAGFIIEYAQYGMPYNEIGGLGSLPAGTHSYGLVYSNGSYRICATLSGYASSWVYLDGWPSIAQPQVPWLTSVTTSTPAGDQITVNWIDMSDDEDGFRIYQWINDTYSLVGTADADATSWSMPGNPSTSYQFEVTAFNDFGESSGGAGSSSLILTEPSPSIAAPTDLTLESSNSENTEITWKWDSQGLYQPVFYLGVSSDGMNYGIGEYVGGPNCYSDFFTPQLYHSSIPTPPAGATLHYRIGVRGQVSDGGQQLKMVGSGFSEDFTASAPPPPAPTNLKAIEGVDGYVVLSWTDNSGGQYPVEFEFSRDGRDWVPLGYPGSDNPGPTALTMLPPGPTYSFRARAIDFRNSWVGGSGYSSYSNVATAQPLIMTAQRAGDKFGEFVSDADVHEGDPSKYVILVNDNHDEDPMGLRADLDDDHADPNVDHDLAKITLKQSTALPTQGIVSIDSSLRLFQDDGTLLSDPTLDLSNPTGYLARLLTSDVEIWAEGVGADSDATISLNYQPPNSAPFKVNLGAVHMTIAQWDFTNKSNQPISTVSSIDGSFLRGVASGDPAYVMPDDGVYFKNSLTDLSPADVAELKITSATDGWNYYDQLVSDAWSPFAASADYNLLYAADLADDTLTKPDQTHLDQSLHDHALKGDTVNATLKTGPTTAPTDQFTRTLKSMQAKIRVDANRDGVITFDDSDPTKSDRTTPDKPYRFWINDNQDNFDPTGAANDFYPDYDEIDPSAAGFVADFTTNKINNARDLEDFSRISIQLPSQLDRTGAGWQMRLTLTATNQNPAIKLVYVNKQTAEKYLTDEATAENMAGDAITWSLISGQTIAPLGTYFDNSDLQSGQLDLLFEGSAVGNGTLTVQFVQAGAVVAQDNMQLRLQSARQMYETYQVGDGKYSYGTDSPSGLTGYTWPDPKTDPGAYTTFHEVGTSPYDASNPSTNDYLLFVHGWRMLPWEKEYFADTAFKRLFWEGYQGKFGAFDWPTEWISTSGTGNPPLSFGQMWADITKFGPIADNFGRSEEKAWTSAAALRSLSDVLYGKYHTSDGLSKVRLLAHSMGNVVASEALRLEHERSDRRTIVGTYIASQGSPWSEAYDGNRTAYHPDADDYAWWEANHISSEYFTSLTDLTNGSAAHMINFFNPIDYAMQSAAESNSLAKPMDGYSRGASDDPNNPGYFHYSPGKRILDREKDRYEIFAYTNLAYSTPIGSTPNVAGPFNPLNQVDLQTAFPPGQNFGPAPWDHSAEFMSTNELRGPYWNQVLSSFGIPPNKLSGFNSKAPV